jgi:hypothetical protein
MKRGLAQEFSVNLNALCTTHMMTMNASEIKKQRNYSKDLCIYSKHVEMTCGERLYTMSDI